ncbi:hypothetical protein [Paenibacillus dendritiformis]|uniref:hypothetical protein n=1 Tax=Paenibacillus dendritiformis TaxID=130049 RepID=UPI000DA737DB|nr:hypothetical protein [Paenibacillus dendritiformis]PZM62049.1 hypothetical protein DOE73_29165 [Paenibacillus dendritiformis]
MKNRFLQKRINFVLLGLDLRFDGRKDVYLQQFHQNQLPKWKNTADLQDSPVLASPITILPDGPRIDSLVPSHIACLTISRWRPIHGTQFAVAAYRVAA